jgi:hypothetical protein
MWSFHAAPGPAHLVMCHPGHVDAELAALDPVVGRREDELRALRRSTLLEGRLVRRPGDRPADRNGIVAGAAVPVGPVE